jgi:hypothetical protein
VSKRTYQNGNTKVTTLVRESSPKEEIPTSQNSNNPKSGFTSVKDILIDSNKDKDRYGNIADKNITSKTEIRHRGKINPIYFSPMTENQYNAKVLWEKLEPNNPDSFGFYLYAVDKLPSYLLFQFASEIQQDKTIDCKGAVFVKKVKSYLKEDIAP